jgi:hypothetical protein
VTFPSALKYDHIRQVFAKCRLINIECSCEVKINLKSHNTSNKLIEVVTKAGLTASALFIQTNKQMLYCQSRRPQ